MSDNKLIGIMKLRSTEGQAFGHLGGKPKRTQILVLSQGEEGPQRFRKRFRALHPMADGMSLTRLVLLYRHDDFSEAVFTHLNNNY